MCYNLLMETGTNLEQQITEMEQALAAKRAQLEGQQTAGEISALPSEKETLHEVVGEKITELAPAGSGPAQSGAGPLPARVSELPHPAGRPPGPGSRAGQTEGARHRVELRRLCRQ